MNKNKVIVIGLDGSSWDLVQPMIDAGELPNLQRMQQQGVSSTLHSTHPAHSAPAWTTFATGVPPLLHGCLDFLVVNNDIDDLDLIDSTKIKYETIYEAMVKAGKTPILINLPNTYPPKLPNNITITSLMTRGDQWIFPESLKDKYPELQNYRLSPNAKLRMEDNFKPYVDDVCNLEQERIAGAKKLFEHEAWDFFFYLSSGTDWVSHVVYDKALREHYAPALRVWKIMDEFIGWVQQHMDKDTTLLVMSDHGFKVYDDIFYMNRWLEQQGYLATKPGEGSFHQDHTKLSKEISKTQQQRKTVKLGKGVRELLASNRLLEKSAKWTYHNIVKKFVPLNVSMDLQLDLANTQVAFPRGSMASMLYVNDSERFKHGIVPENQRAKLTQELKTKLLALKDPHNQPVLGKVYTTQELYGSACIPNAPDLLLVADKYYLSGSLHSGSLFEHNLKNYHDHNGMLLAYGKNIEHRKIQSQHILDLAPTIMHALHLPTLPSFTGNVMDIFQHD